MRPTKTLITRGISLPLIWLPLVCLFFCGCVHALLAFADPEIWLCRPQRRSRGVEVFGQFNGAACQGSVGDRQFCMTDAKCNQPPPPACSETEFRCESGNLAPIKGTTPHCCFGAWAMVLKPYPGTCIKKRLMCNGDYDCEDGSDEDCEPVRKPCPPTVLDTNEQGRTAGYGYDRWWTKLVLDFGSANPNPWLTLILTQHWWGM